MIVAVATAGVPVRLRVMPLGELLDETFKLYRRHFTVIVGVALEIPMPPPKLVQEFEATRRFRSWGMPPFTITPPPA